MTVTLLTALGAAALAAGALALLQKARDRLPIAIRNERSLHTAPIPRVAGVALWAGWLPAACLTPALPAMSAATWFVPWALLVAVSLRDDMRGVAIAPRLAAHAVAAVLFAWIVLPASADTPLLVAFAALAVAWSLNLYNFMDGSDGLAALTAILGFTAYGAVLAWSGSPAGVPFALAAAAVPVFWINRPAARMFLGDVGAVPLGFMAAALGIGGIVEGTWGPWFPILVFLPFVADASVTLARRVLTGQRFWEGHKSHYYQRLHRMGAGHRGTLAVFGALTAGTAGSAAVLACLKPAWGPWALASWCTVCALLFAAIDYHWRKSTTPS